MGFTIAGHMVGNYLRVRGEYAYSHKRRHNCLELPPRARRIPTILRITQDGNRTTSACAENTKPYAQITKHAGNYLRVRGEYANY